MLILSLCTSCCFPDSCLVFWSRRICISLPVDSLFEPAYAESLHSCLSCFHSAFFVSHASTCPISLLFFLHLLRKLLSNVLLKLKAKLVVSSGCVNIFEFVHSTFTFRAKFNSIQSGAVSSPKLFSYALAFMLASYFRLHRRSVRELVYHSSLAKLERLTRELF